MRSTEILMAEHRLIEQVLTSLERIAERAVCDETLDVPAAEDALRFLRGFADAAHHAKEEDVLFPALAEAGMPADTGPTAVMRMEHEEGRALVRTMADAVASAPGDAGAVARFSDAACQFTSLLRTHIQKEDQCLFDMAARLLDAEADARVTEQFAAADAERLTPEARAEYARIANDLAERFGPRRAGAPAPAYEAAGI